MLISPRKIGYWRCSHRRRYENMGSTNLCLLRVRAKYRWCLRPVLPQYTSWVLRRKAYEWNRSQLLHNGGTDLRI